jgi:hypothetical protein
VGGPFSELSVATVGGGRDSHAAARVGWRTSPNTGSSERGKVGIFREPGFTLVPEFRYAVVRLNQAFGVLTPASRRRTIATTRCGR